MKSVIARVVGNFTIQIWRHFAGSGVSQHDNIYIEILNYNANITENSGLNSVLQVFITYLLILWPVQTVFTNCVLLRSEYRGGILSLNRVRRTSVILTIERSIYLYMKS